MQESSGREDFGASRDSRDPVARLVANLSSRLGGKFTLAESSAALAEGAAAAAEDAIDGDADWVQPLTHVPDDDDDESMA